MNAITKEELQRFVRAVSSYAKATTRRHLKSDHVTTDDTDALMKACESLEEALASDETILK